MKALSVFVVSVCALSVMGCSEKQDPQQEEIARLRSELATLHEMMQVVNSVYADIDAARPAHLGVEDQGGTFDTRRMMLKKVREIGATLQESRARISKLEAAAKSYQGDITQLQSLVQNLKLTLQEREQAIATLRSSLEAKPPRLSDVQFDRKLKHLIRSLNGNNASEQATAAQAARDLTDAYPDRSYTPLVIPLMKVLKDTDAGIPVRILAALALHNVRSERGDFAISRVGEFTDDARLKRVCFTLQADRVKQENLARAEKLEGERLDKRQSIANR